MDFVIGAFIGGLAMAVAIAVSTTHEPYGKITEYRLMLDLDGGEEENDDD